MVGYKSRLMASFSMYIDAEHKTDITTSYEINDKKND